MIFYQTDPERILIGISESDAEADHYADTEAYFATVIPLPHGTFMYRRWDFKVRRDGKPAFNRKFFGNLENYLDFREGIK